MADVKQVGFTPIETAWLKQALKSQRAMLVRSAAKEMPGSDISRLRGQEILQIDQLIARLV